MIDRIAPDAIRDCKSYYEELRLRQVDQILNSFDPGAQKDRVSNDLGTVVALVPEQEPLSVETLGASVDCKGSGICTKLVTLEYRYPDRWILFQATVSNRTGKYAITNLWVNQESTTFESRNKFTLRGKSWLHYTFLLMALLASGLTLYALVQCIRTPIRRRKWLWIITTILGIGKLGIEWSSGDLWHKVLYLSILPLGWGYDRNGPFIYVAVPVGAFLFLLMQNRLRTINIPAPQISTASPTAAGDLEPDPASHPSHPLP